MYSTGDSIGDDVTGCLDKFVQPDLRARNILTKPDTHFLGICNLVSQLKSEERKSEILKILLEETKTGTNTYRKLLYKELEDLIDSFDAASKSHSKGKGRRSARK